MGNSKSSFDIGAMGQAIGTNAIGDIANNIFAESATNKQIKASKEMTDYNLQKQLELFDKTGYEAQRQQIEKAGLSVGLMYGKGGSGGSTALSTGNIGNNQVQSGLGKSMEIAQMIEMNKAQIEVMKSQANLNNVEANKKAGADTELINTQIGNLTQGITNQKTINELDLIEKDIKNIELEIDQRTKEIQINEIGAKANEAIGKAKSAMTQGNVDEATYTTKIKTIEQTYTNLALEEGAIRSGINLTNEQIEQVKGLTQNYIEQIKLGKSGQQIQKEYQDSLIKLGYTKVIADGITNVVGMVTKGRIPKTETTTETTDYDKQGNLKGWRETRQTKK